MEKIPAVELSHFLAEYCMHIGVGASSFSGGRCAESSNTSGGGAGLDWA